MARKLRDKYRDLAHQQIHEIKDRRTNDVDTDINDRRARLFQEIIDRLEDELAGPRKVENAPQLKKKKFRPQVATGRGEAHDRKSMLAAKRRERPG